MEFDVVRDVDPGRAEEVATELTAGEAAQSVATPDLADRVTSLIASSDEQSGLLPRDGGRSQVLLHGGCPFGGELLVEVGQQFVVADVHVWRM